MRRLFAPVLLHILHLLPPAVAWSGGSRYIAWFASGVLVAAATVALAQRGGAWRFLAGTLTLLVAFANVLLAASFLVQGAGFNIEFFAHANWETLTLAAVALRPVLLVVLGYFALVLACPFLIPKALVPRPVWLTAAAAVAGLMLSAPAWSFGWHIANVVADVRSALWVPKSVLRLGREDGIAPRVPSRSHLAPPPFRRQPRSLLLIFAESLEATYSRADIFGEDLTPRLTALAASGKQFTDMRQVSLTAWTTGAMVASQCSRPLSVGGQWQDLLQNIATGVAPEMEGATCLGDVLAAHDYSTVLMTGTAIGFGGMETFHAAHGFAERLGFDALSAKATAAAQREWGHERQRWMIEDEALFALARTKIDELANETAPFALVLTTMDTHGPSGFPSARCGNASGLIDAVRCADGLIAEFVKDIRKAHPDVVVALLTDHLMGSGGIDEEVIGYLAPHAEERRLRFAVWGSDVAPGVIDAPGTHFDIMPTLMDFVGLNSWTEHYLGASLLRFDSPWFSHDRPLSLRVVYELPNIRLRPGDAVFFELGPVVTLAGHRFLATSKGLRLRDAVFAIRLAKSQDASTGFRTLGHASAEAVLEDLTQWAAGHMLVGVSTHRPFNRQVLEPSMQPPVGWQDTDVAYFIDAAGTGDFVAGPLRARQRVEIPRPVR